MTRIISWNVNGLRAVAAKGALSPVAAARPDVLCLQEIKATEEQAGPVLPGLPHRCFYPAQRPGYSGTAILSRVKPLSWSRGIGSPTSDREGRVLTAEFPALYVVSAYSPNSQRGLPRLGYRMQWEGQFRRYLQGLSAQKPVVFCGDLNVAHQEIDIARPAENRMNAGFTDRERRSFTRLLAAGFLDSFRSLHPREVRYTWWSYATGSRGKNIGWRIDYVCLSSGLAGRLREAFIMDHVLGSDHCPVGVVLDGRP